MILRQRWRSQGTTYVLCLFTVHWPITNASTPLTVTPYWWQILPIELRRRKSFSLCKFLLIKIMHVLTCTCSCHLKCLFIGYMDMHRLRQWVLSLGEGNLKIGSIFVAYGLLTYQNPYRIIAELAERSPIIIQNSSNPSSRKIWMYDRTTVQGATCNMRGQLIQRVIFVQSSGQCTGLRVGWTVVHWGAGFFFLFF